MYTLGFDVGSSSVKMAVMDAEHFDVVYESSYPKTEFVINSSKKNWAEQDPHIWWDAICRLCKELISKDIIDISQIKSIGISYQMHGLVLVDERGQLIRPSIIWCDSRAVTIGENAFKTLGKAYCLENLLNSPGNFTASKLKWVKENEPESYKQVHKMMLPGDYIHYQFTGEISTTLQGMSEAMLWDFQKNEISEELLSFYEIDESLIPERKPCIGHIDLISKKASEETGLPQGIAVAYRGGDQPNNAMSLGVLQPGEIAATGGTSGVVYGVTDQYVSDSLSRINAFAHVNHTPDNPRIGQLLCINGAGSHYAWLRKSLGSQENLYEHLERIASKVDIGSDELLTYPFGNGAERMLQNKQVGAKFSNIHFGIHDKAHLVRSSLEGIAFSFYYGMKIFLELGMSLRLLKVGDDNLFQSSVFSTTLANISGCTIQVMRSNGAIGAAFASGAGVGIFKSLGDISKISKLVKTYSPNHKSHAYIQAYLKWEKGLVELIQH